MFACSKKEIGSAARAAAFLMGLTAMLVPCSEASPQKAKIVRAEILSGGQKRSYYLFVPESVKPESPAPLLVTLHGQGRNGRILIEEWKDLASKEGIILVGPDALAPETGWNTPRDGPQFLCELVEDLRAKYPIDPRRIYLFGHSAGGTFGLYMGLLESEYFAAVAVSAGGLRVPEDVPFMDGATRKISLALWVGTQDSLVPVKYARATRDALAERTFPVRLREIPGHTHDYYSRSKQINKEVWAFLREQRLASDPRYTTYRIP